MTSNLPSKCCTAGFRHDGEPTGIYQTIGGYECYTANPATSDIKRTILILTDVLGHKFVNVQFIADRFAANGYFCVVPDLFHGDPIPLNAPDDLSIMSWLNGSDTTGTPGHLPPRVDPVVSSVISALRSTKGIERLGGVGYCFGGKYVVRFLQNPEHLDAGFVAHPSFVTSEELRGVSRPISIAAAAQDPVFPAVKRRETEDILSEGMEGGKMSWQMCLFSSVDHGFAVRCDATEPRQKFAMDQAFLQAVAWFNEHL